MGGDRQVSGAAPRAGGGTAALAAGLLALVLWRVLALRLNGLDLFMDEAQYVVWARDLASGYYSKPPLLAWIIALTTHACGEGQACVRSAATVMYALTALCIHVAMRGRFDARSGVYAALIYITLPLIGIYSLFISTDAPLSLMTALAIVFALRALRTGATADWLLLGLSAGLGLLAKYSFGLLILAFVAFLLADPGARRLWRTPGPWLAAALGAVVFAPNLAWNAGQHFITFTHTAEISQLDKSSLHPLGLLAFVAGQCLAFGPIAVWLLVRNVRLPSRVADRDPAQQQALRLLLTLAALPLLFFCGLAFASRANLNWPMFAFVPLSMLLGHALAQRARVRALVLVAGFGIVAGGLVQHYPAWSAWAGMRPAYRHDPFGRVAGWSALAGRVSDVMQRHPDCDILTDTRTLAAELLYYVKPTPEGLAMWNPSGRITDHFRLTRDVAARPAGSFIYVGEGADPAVFADAFERVEVLQRIEVSTHPDHAHRVWLMRLTHFKGYPARDARADDPPGPFD
jgi:4-amino-4-deoxy-L-arabinose transferase-like glycosyltransferase